MAKAPQKGMKTFGSVKVGDQFRATEDGPIYTRSGQESSILADDPKAGIRKFARSQYVWPLAPLEEIRIKDRELLKAGLPPSPRSLNEEQADTLVEAILIHYEDHRIALIEAMYRFLKLRRDDVEDGPAAESGG